jgi:sugar lactone lactonase YvrE
VADGYADRVQACDPDSAFASKRGGPFAIGITGPFNGWFAVATSLALSPDDTLFVADFYNDRVQKFAPDGTFLARFGETGDGPGQFRHAIAVDVAADGTVFVADFRNNRIQKWRPKQAGDGSGKRRD